ncbi:MAG: PAS domain S-box protein [Methanoregula sp.]|nr:MAG: PAS domain S-box protein [Methanoregula sp.]
MPGINKETGCIESAVIENALVMIIVLQRHGVVTAWNHAAEKITGYTSDEVIGSSDVWKLLYPDTKYRGEVTKKITSNLAARNYFEDLETTIRTKSGEKRIIRWNTNEVTGKDGKYQIVTIGLDITRTRELDEFRESIIENANVLISVLDRKGNVLVWNQAAEKITGYSRDEVIGKRDIWKQLYPDPDYRRTITTWISSIIKERRVFENLDTTITTKAGEKRIIRWNTREINAGAQAREITIGRDITRQRDLDAFQESVIENANILITVLDAQGNVLVWNKAAEAITGYTKGEVIKKRDIWKQLYPDPEYRQGITRRITKIIKEDRYFENFETKIVNKKGMERILAWNTREIDGGTQKREIAIARDITEQRKAEQALVAYIGEMAMRLKQPVEIVRENLEDTVKMIRGGKLSEEEICIILETQIRNSSQILTNIVDFQQAIAEKDEQIPEAYRKFLEE